MNKLLFAAVLAVPLLAKAADPGESATTSDEFQVNGQFTNVLQAHPAFAAPYSGANSLAPGFDSNETSDLTVFLAARLWGGAEFYLDPEVDQGFGLSNTLGVAGFTSGDGYKVGKNRPYLRLPRFYVRQVIDLDGERVDVPADVHQMPGSMLSNHLILTAGKFSVVDLFDTNTYAHDPRGDFLNWSVIDDAAFDYAADAWGYTYGAAAEWTQDWWTARLGYFDLSKTPNSTDLDSAYVRQYEWVTEFEARSQRFGAPGKVKVLAFLNTGFMGSYRDAVRLAQDTGTVPDTAKVRRLASRPGLAASAEQELFHNVGLFVRASVNQGNVEAFDFTDVNRSLATGLAFQGALWNRSTDSAGLAVVVNALSSAARDYFAAGGLGVLVGDGRLNYGLENITEVYYNWKPYEVVTLGFDYQYVDNPAYNRDRGPVSVFGLRVHVEL